MLQEFIQLKQMSLNFSFDIIGKGELHPFLGLTADFSRAARFGSRNPEDPMGSFKHFGLPFFRVSVKEESKSG